MQHCFIFIALKCKSQYMYICVCVCVCTYIYILSNEEKYEKDYFTFRAGVTSGREEEGFNQGRVHKGILKCS